MMGAMTRDNGQGGRVLRVWVIALLALFALIGLIASAGLILLLVEGGLVSILRLGQQIGQIITAPSPPGPGASSYTGHILTVIIITLTAASLLIGAVTLAANSGLKASIGQIAREVRDELSQSVHGTVREMTQIGHEGMRAQMASDRSVVEWRTHYAWLGNPGERERAVLRCSKEIEFAASEIELALERLDRSAAPAWAKEANRAGLEELRMTILNNQGCYLAELYALGCLDPGGALVRQKVVPPADEAYRTARRATEQALQVARSTNRVRRIRVQESGYYVVARMGSEDDRAGLRERVERLLDEAEAVTESGEADLSAFVAERRAVYADLLG